MSSLATCPCVPNEAARADLPHMRPTTKHHAEAAYLQMCMVEPFEHRRFSLLPYTEWARVCGIASGCHRGGALMQIASGRFGIQFIPGGAHRVNGKRPGRAPQMGAVEASGLGTRTCLRLQTLCLESRRANGAQALSARHHFFWESTPVPPWAAPIFCRRLPAKTSRDHRPGLARNPSLYCTPRRLDPPPLRAETPDRHRALGHWTDGASRTGSAIATAR